ncbi:hypothetical protein [Candidatus Carsonella ruddii]|uniref:Uncharacterized protein n=1 Tax=Candidatus Carsonella ruddii PC isolate NHV TaxID=1202540 RepID=J3TEV0_CARRU|nr:hypothetical protein [Candidatus Carsonella ruddii]AFP84407.1 hypothetical protein A357_0211 [Candidatus Carsonella ruddii PC isolate NHV]
MNNIIKKKIFFLNFTFFFKKNKQKKKKKIKIFKFKNKLFKKVLFKSIISIYTYFNINNIVLCNLKKPFKKIFNLILVNNKINIIIFKKNFIRITNFKNKQFNNYKKLTFKNLVPNFLFLINNFDFINYWFILKNIKKIFLNKIKKKNYIVFYNRILILKLSNL